MMFTQRLTCHILPSCRADHNGGRCNSIVHVDDVELVDRLEGLAGVNQGVVWPGNLSNIHQEASEAGVRLADDMAEQEDNRHYDCDVRTPAVTFSVTFSGYNSCSRSGVLLS